MNFKLFIIKIDSYSNPFHHDIFEMIIVSMT